MINDIPYPKSVSHAGAVYGLRDGRETPDTQLAMFEYEQLTLMMEAALWTGYMKKTPIEVRDSDKFPNWPFSGTKVELLGLRASCILGGTGAAGRLMIRAAN